MHGCKLIVLLVAGWLMKKLKDTLVLWVMVLAAASWAPLANADSLSVASRIEIESLLSKLKESGCVFNRNGTWYSSGEAQAHLARKLEYLVDKEAVASAEQFIERAATKSSMTGQRYMVKCGSKPPVPSSKWLHAELQEIRATPASPAREAR